ncbi:hypothetical protein B0H13DRAFT_2346701 [Mycena leptocephala]|nr:hypothetical protein B0H13DRAFT_2346701 [Mycena leptocephala]
MPPHINHKQKAVSPIQFFSTSHPKLAQDPELPVSPIDWSYTPHLLEAQWMTYCICISGVALVSAAFRYVPFQTMSPCLSCRRKADDDFGSMKPPPLPTPHSRPTASASTLDVLVPHAGARVPVPAPEDADPYTAPPHVVSLPPPDYVIAARTSTASPSRSRSPSSTRRSPS